VVEIADKTKRSVEVTLWAEQAEDFPGTVGNVLALKNVRTNDYQGNKTLTSAYNLTQMELNPEVDDAKNLSLWYKNNSSTILSEARNISGSLNQSGSSMQTAVGTFKELKEEGMSQTDGVQLKIPCTIMGVRHDENAPIYYKSTPTTDKHKVVENKSNPENGKAWFCPRTNQYFDTYTPRYVLSILAADFSGAQYLNCFDEWGKAILGCEAREVEATKNRDIKRFEEIFVKPLFQRLMIKVKAKEDNYGDERRLKCVVATVEKMDYVKDTRILIEKIKELTNSD